MASSLFPGSSEEVLAYLVVKIPYGDIKAVNMDSDEYYYFPHIYCHFTHNDEPYEELVYCQEVDMNDWHVHYSELVSYSDVQKHSKQVAEKIAIQAFEADLQCVAFNRT